MRGKAVKHFDIIVCGVGGTGVIGLGQLIRKAAILEGRRVLSSESRGSGQRGGPAVASVRITATGGEAPGDRKALWTGSVGIGGADLMIATEAAEALRNAHYLSESSVVVLNTFTLKPTQTRQEMKAGSMKYPPLEEVVSSLKQLTPSVHVFDASDVSFKHFGTYRTTNPILVGLALARGLLPLEKESIASLLEGDAREAFELGLRDNI